MAHCKFEGGVSDVYVGESNKGTVCLVCKLANGHNVYGVTAAHFHEHREAGHLVPDSLIEAVATEEEAAAAKEAKRVERESKKRADEEARARQVALAAKQRAEERAAKKIAELKSRVHEEEIARAEAVRKPVEDHAPAPDTGTTHDEDAEPKAEEG